MMDWLEMTNVIQEEVEFRDWHIGVYIADENFSRAYLQVQFLPPGASVLGGIQPGRKWWLSQHMTKSELVQTALKAVLTAVEHEAREDFLYRGRAVFGPHLDVDALWSVAEQADVRAPA